jgi:basic membrane protein A and related proteins
VRRNTIALLLSATLLFAGGACGSDDDTDSAQETTEQKQLRVGIVTDIGGLNDRGFNQLAYEGLKRAESQLGVKGRALLSSSNADYVPNLSSLARQKYDLIIGVGFLEAEAIASVAAEFPEINFAIIDVDHATLKGKPPNVRGLLWREQESGYLVGYLAALMAKEAGGPPVVSTVGGIKIPPVDRFIAGYQAGAKAAVPGVKTLNDYSQDFVDQAKCKEIALNQIARGSQVVFAVAGGCGLGALDAAKEKNVWGIGGDADQAYLGPHMLTSELKKVDIAVYDTIKAVQDGTFKGGENGYYDFANEGAGLGKISPKVSEEIVAKTREIEQKLADGEITDIPTTVR